MSSTYPAKPYARKVRVAALIQQTLSTYLNTKMLDPRLQGLTLIEVDCSPDLKQAAVTVQCAEGAEVRSTLKTLQAAASHLRHHLAQSLDLRVTPQLRFKAAASDEGQVRIHQLLSGIEETTPDRTTPDSHTAVPPIAQGKGQGMTDPSQDTPNH